MGSNDLILKAYDGSSPILDPQRVLDRHANLRMGTVYPGGLYKDCSFTIPDLAPRKLPFKQGNRLRVYNGATLEWEGKFSDVEYTTAGMQVRAKGHFDYLLGRRYWRKWWADDRTREHVWVWQETGATEDLAFLDRSHGLRFVPKNEAWTSGQYVAVRYDAPAGTTIKRVTFSYDFQEGGQNWILRLYDVTNPGSLNDVTVSGTGTVDVTLSPVSQSIELRLISNANQTPTSDGTYYADITDLFVYAEWEDTSRGGEGTLSMHELSLDILDSLSGVLSANTHKLDSALTEDIRPFIAEPQESIANLLKRAAEYGDTNNEPIGYGLRLADEASDELPLLFTEALPTLDDFEWRVGWNNENLVGGSLAQSADQISNYVWVNYRDARGWPFVTWPESSAALEDADSTGESWGRLDTVLNAGQASEATIAQNMGLVHLSWYKDRHWVVKRPLRIQGYITNKIGQQAPVTRIKAGDRLKIDDFVDEDVIFLVTDTTFTQSNESVTLQSRPPTGRSAGDIDVRGIIQGTGKGIEALP